MIGAISALADDNDRTFVLKLYQEYYGLVRKTAYNLTKDSDSSEDLINDTFIKLINKISVLRTLDCCRVAAYVVYTARGVAINFVKHRDVENKHLYYAEDMDCLGAVEPAATVEDLVIYHQGIDSMWSAILQLPEKQRDLLYFKYILEMDDAAIAQILMITPASVRQYLTRARREAKQLMKEEVNTHAE